MPIFAFLSIIILCIYCNPLFSSNKQAYNLLIHDTILDTIAPVETKIDSLIDAEVKSKTDTIISTDTLKPSEKILPDSLATEVDITDVPAVLPDTIAVVDTVPAIEITPRPTRVRVVFDQNKVYTVDYDSLLALPSAVPVVYSGNEIFNENLLHAKKISPEKFEESIINWYIIIIIIAAALIGFGRYYQPSGLKQNFKAALNNRNFIQLLKEQNVLSQRFSYFLLACFFACVAMLFYQSIKFFGLININDLFFSIKIYFLIFMLIIMFYIAKYIGLKFIAYVFKTQQSINHYFQNIMLFNQIIGVVLLPLLLFTILYQEIIFLTASWVVFIFINLYKVFRSISLGHNSSKFSLYYLFLYLCAVEIIPMLLIAKASINYFQVLQ